MNELSGVFKLYSLLVMYNSCLLDLCVSLCSAPCLGQDPFCKSSLSEQSTNEG